MNPDLYAEIYRYLTIENNVDTDDAETIIDDLINDKDDPENVGLTYWEMLTELGY